MEFLVALVLASGVLQQPPASVAAPDAAPALAASAVLPDTGRADSARADAGAAPFGPVEPAPWPRLEPPAFAAGGVEPQRPRAVEVSEAYHTRLAIHYVASFLTVPLFVTEYLLGTKLYNNPPGSQSTRDTHRLVALGLGGLFAVNTVTGAWNLWDSRHTPEGRLRRYLHAGLMFAADAGFVATASVAPHGRRILTATQADRSLHRTLALTSMGTALASYAMMLIWRN